MHLAIVQCGFEQCGVVKSVGEQLLTGLAPVFTLRFRAAKGAVCGDAVFELGLQAVTGPDPDMQVLARGGQFESCRALLGEISWLPRLSQNSGYWSATTRGRTTSLRT